MSRLDLLLVNAPSRLGAYGKLSQLSAIEPPVWAGLIATYIKQRGFSVEILDAEADGLTLRETAVRIINARPRLAAFSVYGHQPSASTQCLPGASAVAKIVKELSDVPTLAFGTHPSALPERTLREEPFDFVCQGEGPATVVALIRNLRGEITRSEIPGAWFHGDPGDLLRNSPASNITDLDTELPRQAWELIDLKKYRAHNWHLWTGDRDGGYASVQTSLGCVFHCQFCCIQAPFGDSAPRMRYWSPANVAAQIATLVNDHGITNLKFPDEMFCLNRQHVWQICNHLIDMKLGDRLNIWAYARIDTVKDVALLELMRTAGFRWLGIGIESGSKHVRDGVSKGKFDEEDIYAAVGRVRAAGLYVGANYIFGLPDDTHESMRQTLDLAIDINSEWANFYCLPAGTPVYTPEGAKPIETIQAGEEVLSWSGRSVVTRQMSRSYTGKMFTIKPRYLPAVRVTDEHPVMVVSVSRMSNNDVRIGSPRWVKPGQIIPFSSHWTPCDAVVIPKSCFTGTRTEIDFSPFVRGQVGGGRKGGQLNDSGKRFLKPWPLTEELAELFGWYIAEGSRGSRINNQVVFSLGANEPDNIARVRELVAHCFGYKTRVQAERNVRRIMLTSKVLIRALPAIFGDESRNKRLPPFLMNAQLPCIKAFLKGYIAGDGTSYPNANGQHNVSTSSSVLAHQLLLLFLKIGVVPGCFRIKGSENIPGIVTRRDPQFRLSWTVGGNQKHYLQDERHFYIPLASVSSEPFDGMVYNVETGDETYGVPFIVHNCTMAYPGSPLYKIAGERGWMRPDDPGGPGWIGYSQHAYETLPLPTETLTAAEVLRFRDDAFLAYFSRRVYRETLLAKFGEAAVADLDLMLALGKPRRQILGDTQ